VGVTGRKAENVNSPRDEKKDHRSDVAVCHRVPDEGVPSNVVGEAGKADHDADDEADRVL
jgi:hypothetical protein